MTALRWSSCSCPTPFRLLRVSGKLQTLSTGGFNHHVQQQARSRGSSRSGQGRHLAQHHRVRRRSPQRHLLAHLQGCRRQLEVHFQLRPRRPARPWRRSPTWRTPRSSRSPTATAPTPTANSSPDPQPSPGGAKAPPFFCSSSRKPPPSLHPPCAQSRAGRRDPGFRHAYGPFFAETRRTAPRALISACFLHPRCPFSRDSAPIPEKSRSQKPLKAFSPIHRTPGTPGFSGGSGRG